MISKFIRAGAAAGILLGTTLVLTPAPAQAASCSASITGSGYSARGSCSGYSSTGTFRVLATYCAGTRCYTAYGNWAFLQGGTSTTSSQYRLSNPRIEYGPAGG